MSDPGLCATCAFSRVIDNTRGSRFYLCRLSETDSKFRKYPPLPVLECAGFRPVESDPNEQHSTENRRPDD